MKYNTENMEELIDYFINQTYKMLNLFEEHNPYGYKHVHKISQELYGLSCNEPTIAGDYRFDLVSAKWELLYEDLYFLDSSHSDVKNLAFEVMTILKDIKSDVV